LGLLLATALPVFSQAVSREPAPQAANFVRQFGRDQDRIWTSPAHFHKKDLRWLLPAAGGAALLIATDGRNMQERIRTGISAQDHAVAVSNLGLGGLAAIPAVLAWHGWRERDNDQQETAWMAARAVASAAAATELLQMVTLREKPGSSGSARFFQSNLASASFPSLHSSSAWALASVLAHRYPGWLARTAFYGTAAAVSVSRVLGREHSPSDVVVGGALGWAIGRLVAGERTPSWWSHPEAAKSAPQAERSESAEWADATYVPLDSWIYGALDRLAALGLVPSQTSGLRPWTRDECRRQVLEAEGLLKHSGGDAPDLVRALREELDRDRGAVAIDSVYVRNGVIAGPALTDSFHIGQTWANDFGRPFGRGWNSYEGFTAHAESGAWFGYVQGEFQHAPGAAPYSLPVRQALADLDAVPLAPPSSAAGTDRFRTLDAYVGARVGNFEFSIGKQSLWWGPTADSPLSFGNNAEPSKNFRASLVHPVVLPGILRRLGEIRGEVVFGKLGGQKYTWRPWFNAQKLTFKLTENLEMGFTRWSIFWGLGHRLRWLAFCAILRNCTAPTDRPVSASTTRAIAKPVSISAIAFRVYATGSPCMPILTPTTIPRRWPLPGARP
jgi:membrane-associated phospholipid phosphatase